MGRNFMQRKQKMRVLRLYDQFRTTDLDLLPEFNGTCLESSRWDIIGELQVVQILPAGNPPWSQRWATNDADSLTGPRWDGQIAPAASAAPPLGPWILGGRSGPSGPSHSSGPQTSRSLCPGPCRQYRRPRLQFQTVSRKGCWCPGP